MSGLTLADAARMMREAVKDKSYRSSPIGLEVGRYLRWKKNEWGATTNTIRDYEICLSRLALDHADLELRDFEPPVGTERLREFLDRHWGERAPRTRAKNRSILMDFFSWAVRETRVHGNPVTAIARPRKRGVDRGVFDAGTVLRVVTAQPRLRDRIALQLLFRLALRKSELAAVQFKHLDLSRRRLKVFGKGGTVHLVPIVFDDLRLDLERHILERQAQPDEFLLYPEKLGPLGGGPGFSGSAPNWPVGSLWENRHRPLSPTAMHRWWSKCLERAEVPHRPMHEARHTAITDFLRATGNLKLAQQLARHASIQTTADIYGHLDDTDLERALRELDARARERA